MKNKLKQTRQNLNISAKELAKRAGTTEVQIFRLENGQRKLTVEWLLRLCGALDVTADEIVDLPLKGLDKKACDPVLLASVLGYLMEACDKKKLKPTRKQLAKWTALLYAASPDLSAAKLRNLANTLVDAAA